MSNSSDTKRVIVTGATGLIGSALCAALQQRGYAVVVFSRDPDAARAKLPDAAAYVTWQPSETPGSWAGHLDGAYGVVHLAGGSLFTGRQTEDSVRTETASRVQAIHGLVTAMAQATNKPQVFISASSVGAYGYAGFSDAEYTEESPAGEDFWGRDSAKWEEAALTAQQHGVRTVVLRPGYVLAAQPGGGLAQQVAQFRRGFGGPVLPGRQWSPWVHLADVAGLALFALEDARVQGPLNVVAPGIVRNREFSRLLGQAVGKPSWLPVPGFALRMGLGIAADIIVHGRRVIPAKALALGYAFQYPTLPAALRDLISQM